ncbi:SRPBCC family protein [uncultured Rhodoblastus sp.]|uniref:type II toxin-antitoxin system RatA family toxin n=1 Tax=uncultured Rhodoblastus sp. TaxID=543037 RepID=UPI0025EDE1FC|nr:SRPBCC family protein [uncultured Rhodoblastus sp.]
MPSFRTSHIVPHTTQQMFDLVADMESYPQFVPLCKSVRNRRRFIGQGGKETVISQMEVGYKAIRETFTTRVVLDPQAGRIAVEYVDGPFSHLENSWVFTETGEGQCRVDFFIAYEFRSRALATLMGSMFDAAFRKFASAFEERADVVFRTG